MFEKIANSIKEYYNTFIKKPKQTTPIKMNIIDISHHNGVIDWVKVANQTNPFKIDGVILKASTGVGGKDTRVDFNSKEIIRNNLKLGYYHYCTLNNENELIDAEEEANWFIKVLKTLPKPNLPVALDIEDPNKLSSLDPSEVLSWIKKFFETLEKAGYKDYVLYSYMPYLNANLPKNHNLGNIPLWIAQYRNTLSLPNGWSKFWLWQYTDKGKVDGIKGNVDLNKQ